MPVNSILTGKVKVDLKFNYGVPYLAANAGTDDESITVTESTEAAQPIEATVADILANKYLNDLVTIKTSLSARKSIRLASSTTTLMTANRRL